MPKSVVNYLWINEEEFVPDCDNGKICGVPLALLDKAIHNAQKYSQADFKIWLDHSLLDNNSLAIVKNHLKDTENVAVFDLKDALGEYAEDPIFCEPKDIWARVDFAKTLLCKHCFENSDVERAFFSDFDVDDVFLDQKFIGNALKKSGVFFGSTFEDGSIENSFLAFQKGSGEVFLNDYLIPATHNEASFNINGYPALQNALSCWLSDGKTTLPYHDHMHPMVHKTGFKTKQNSEYTDINGDTVSDTKGSSEYVYPQI